MKVTYVTVRYGAAMVGGAEQACRQLAEHLAADGVDVSVHTTCAIDAVTWADELPAGSHGRGRGHRAPPPQRGRAATPASTSSAPTSSTSRRANPAPAEAGWLERQGPVCPAAVDGARRRATPTWSSPRPTCTGPRSTRRARTPPGRFVLHPPPTTRRPSACRCSRACSGRPRAWRSTPTPNGASWNACGPHSAPARKLVVGLGGSIAVRGRRRRRVPCRRRASATGRTCCASDASTTARAPRCSPVSSPPTSGGDPGPLALVFAGPVVHPPIRHPDVIVTGPLSTRRTSGRRWPAPSASSTRRPTRASASCCSRRGRPGARRWSTPAAAATSEHARRSGAGLAFGGYASVRDRRRPVLGDPAAARAMGDAGRAYVRRPFGWAGGDRPVPPVARGGGSSGCAPRGRELVR